MIYVEFIEREAAIPREIFRYLADQSASWVQADQDQYLGQLGRTMRLGPHPAYLTLFRVKGLFRIDEWESYFRSEAYSKNLRSFAMQRSLRMARDGCYDELIPTEQIADGIYYLEYFTPPDDSAHEAVADHFQERTRRHPEGQLALLLQRIGRLAPDPGGIVAWRFSSSATAEPMLRDCYVDNAFRVIDAGFYRRFGEEII
jgi:hypothetical protein